MSANLRDQLRGAIFNSENSKPKSKVIEFFGQQIEVRQPPVGALMDMREGAKDRDSKEQLIAMLMNWVFVPGTDEKLFEPADQDQLLAMPFGTDFTRVSNAVTELTDVNILNKEATKN